MFTKMHSPLIILVCGNTKRALPLKLKEYWIQDASAVTENILIMAESLELSTCWNGVHPQEKLVKKIKDILELPEHFIPMSLIHVGYKDEEKKPNSGYDSKFVTFIE